jgi:hypothetical protein
MRPRAAFLAWAAVLVLVSAPAWGAIGIFDGSLDLGVPGDPNLPGSATYDGGSGIYTVIAGGSDWWSAGEFGHFAYTTKTGDFRLEALVQVMPIEGMNDWTKAGVAIRNDIDTGEGNQREVNFLVGATSPLRANLGGTMQFRLNAAWNMGDTTWWGAQPSRVAVQKQTVTIEGSDYDFVEGFLDYLDGNGWQRLNGFAINTLNPTVYAGLAVTSHDNARTESGMFAEVQFVSPTAPEGVPTIRPWEPGMYVPGVEGGEGYFGVREVWNNGNVGNLNDTYNSLKIQGEGAVVEDWTTERLGGPFDISDEANPAGHSTIDGNYGVVEAGHVGRGGVEDVAIVVHGTIEVKEADNYTFDVNSDDGFELMIDGAVAVVANIPKGSSDVVGTVYLTKGEHDLQLLYWEDGGGASCELLAARGTWGGWNDRFMAVGSGETRPGMPGWPNPPSVTHSPDPGWNVAVLGAIPARDMTVVYNTAQNYWTDPNTAPDPNQVWTAVANSINYTDDGGGGGGGRGYPQEPFPGLGTNSAGDDDFLLAAKGTVHITDAGDYSFVVNGDDGSFFRITNLTDPNADKWTLSMGGGGGGSITALTDGTGFMFDGWGRDAIGTITLDPGDYDCELIFSEYGGGAYVGLWVQFGEFEVLLGDDTPIADIPADPGLDLVPEPATLTLLALGGLGALIRRRKR